MRAVRRLVLVGALVAGFGACRVSDTIQSVGETDLQRAIKAHDEDGVRRLLASGASLGHSLDEQNGAWALSLLELSPSDPRTTRIVEQVLQVRAREVAPGAPDGVARVVNMEVSHGVARNRSRRPSSYPVELAARRWSPDGIDLLLRKGLDIRSQGVADALVHSASNGCEPCARRLLDAGADVNAVDSERDTPLAMARRVRSAQMVALLVSRGARVPDDAGPSPVVGAIERMLGRLLVPDIASPGGTPTEWIEGAAIAAHPVGRALVEASASTAAGQGNGTAADLPLSTDAIRRGLEAGSVLAIDGARAELHLVVFEQASRRDGPSVASTATRKLSFVRLGEAWQFEGS